MRRLGGSITVRTRAATARDWRAWGRLVRAGLCDVLGLHQRARRRLDGSRAVVLAYHRVLPHERAQRHAVEPGMYVTPETFAAHLDWLEADCRVLPLQEIAARLARELPLPPGACALTFDDGWRDNLEFAGPELRRRGLPATLFVVTERVGSAGAFWPDEACRRLAPLAPSEQRDVVRALGVDPVGSPVEHLLEHLKQVAGDEREKLLEALRARTESPVDPGRELLDWAELDRLAAGGIDVESHGATHAILTTLPDVRVERELAGARGALREHGHGRHALLAYPSGAHDDRVVGIARRVGYRAAVTTLPGLAATGVDPLRLPRVVIHDDVSRTRVEFRHRVPGTA